MLPIRNFSDIIGFMKTYQRLIATPFNIIILYKTEHMEFRQYIIRRFEKIHHETQNISCIIVDTPPITWTTTKDYKEYFEIVGNDYKPALNDFEVDMICRYMDIPAESLPCLVCFKNIEKHNFNCFSFSSSSMDEIRDFFDSFLEKTSMYSHQGREYVRTMIELGKEFPKCRKFIDWNRNNPIETRLSTALNAIEDYRKPRKLTPPIEEAIGVEASVLGDDINGPSSSIPIKTVSGGQLMEKWGMDAFELINLIQNHGLTAYDGVYSVDINKNSFNPALITELTTGDLEVQKVSMQRLRFEPSIVETFELMNPDLLETQSMERLQAHTDDSSEVTSKEMVIECCRETARQLLKKNPKMTIAAILKATKNFEDCFVGKEDYKVSDRRLRNWLENLEYNKKAGRPKGS